MSKLDSAGKLPDSNLLLVYTHLIGGCVCTVKSIGRLMLKSVALDSFLLETVLN